MLAACLRALPLLLILCQASALGADTSPLPGAAGTTDSPTALTLHLEGHSLTVELAITPLQRRYGLMGRRSLAENAGMLFDYQRPQRVCMWMKDTQIPLSVAFISEEGRIVNIEDMQPHDLTSHCAAAPVRYALEVNQGWFARRDIVPGSIATGLPRP